MRRHQTILAKFFNYPLLLVIVLLASGMAAAQTPNASADKPGPEAKPTVAEPTATTTKAVASSDDTEAVGAAPDSVKAEFDPPNAKAEAPVAATPQPSQTPVSPPCVRKIKADVVAIPQPIMLNRLGAAIPDGLIFALKGDTVGGLGKQLRADRRPRPLVLRANVGDCVTVTFTNNIPVDNFKVSRTGLAAAKTDTTEVSLHVQGVEWVSGSMDDGSYVGTNNSSLASPTPSPSPAPSPMPPQTQTYTLYAKAEGTYLLYTEGDRSSIGTQLSRGLFGALNIQPQGAEWYRSQVSADDLLLATYNAKNPAQVPPGSLVCATPTNCTFKVKGKTIKVIRTPSGYLNTADNHPLIKYDAVYPSKRADGTALPAQLVGTPILNMLDGTNLVRGDLTAIITGPGAGRFPGANKDPNKPDPDCNAEGKPVLPGSPPVDPLFCKNPASPDRKQPYREFTIIYHGGLSPIAAQAFPVFREMPDTLTAGEDAFAINYGTGGIGAEVYANRIGVGPMGDCVDCKFEEFFLSAWSVGDPAMMVDKPANSNQLDEQAFQPPCNTTAAFNTPPCGGKRTPTNPPNANPYAMTPTAKATAAFFPDDPSNVYHSYINDHVKFRILHGGRDVTHVHHQHAHQWLQSPNSDQGSYLDSQMISPGASYTLEMVYNGSGNRNKVVGDSIFHCHFYPHFAAGMWSMWRTHDVFEAGTFVFPGTGKVVPGSRALPDGEIVGGSPNPALVPVPTLPMAPLPAYVQIKNNVQVNGVTIPNGGQIVYGGVCQSNKINGLDVIGGCTNGQQLNGTVLNSQFDGTKMTGQFQPSAGNKLENPGFPFFIPGVAGARPPHPPLDFAPDGAGGFLDGGLPRHVVTGGTIAVEQHSETDWSKDLATMVAVQLPEDGTVVEKAAMTYFGKRCYATFLPDGTPGSCPSSNSIPPQSTMLTPPTGFILNGLPLGPQRGAPFADPGVDDNGNAIGNKRVYKAAAIQLDVTFNKLGWHYPQQRMLSLWEDVAPTIAYKFGSPGGRQPEPLFFRGNSKDIIEYWHTNLVPAYYKLDKFQVRTPTDILGQHIHLVKFDVTSSDGAGNGFNYEDGTFSPEEVQHVHKALTAPGGVWKTCAGCPTTLRPPQPPPAGICSVSPVPPDCASNWLGAQTTIQRWYLDPLVDDNGVDRTLRTVFTHDHFGPSTHQQAGLYAGLVVEPEGSTWTSNDGQTPFGARADGGPTSWQARIITSNKNDSYREFLLEFQDLQLAYTGVKIQGEDQAINPPPKPSLVTTGIPNVPAGTQSVNYTNEPLAKRVGSLSAFPAPSKVSDLSYAYDNSIQSQFTPPGQNADPMTPLMRAYQNDNVQIRVLVGAHVFSHQFNLEGPTWFSEPSWKNSGYRSAQAMGLSEHFEMLFKVPSSSAASSSRKCPDKMSDANCIDFLYSPSLDPSGLANGLWGIFRSYAPTKKALSLEPLPNNPVSSGTDVSYATCPTPLPAPAVKRTFNLTAVTAQKALANQSPLPKQIVFNGRSDPGNPSTLNKALTNPLGIMYVRTGDLNADGTLKPGVPVEPLILRANAGDCIEVNLTNAIDGSSDVYKQDFAMSPPLDGPLYPHKVSRYVGLHPQLLSYDVATSNGFNVGWNSQGQADQSVPTGKTVKYQWYAGKVERAASGKLSYTPVEFGTLNLFPSDPLFQHINGLFGSMVIEPQGSKWQCGEPGMLADCEATGGTPPTTRASATVSAADGTFREFVLMISDDMRIVSTDPGVTTASAVNYRTEPWQFRYAGNTNTDYSCMLSNQLIQQTALQPKEPQTPIFRAEIGDKVRFRLAHPVGTGTSQVFTISGHAWQRNPYTNNSQKLGSNNLSQWLGSRDNHGSTDHADLLIDKAGGEARRGGDYLYSVFVPIQARQGAWGVFRVGPANAVLQPNAACILLPPAPGYVPPTPNDDLERFIRKPQTLGGKP
jgi:hypothetical protein